MWHYIGSFKFFKLFCQGYIYYFGGRRYSGTVQKPIQILKKKKKKKKTKKNFKKKKKKKKKKKNPEHQSKIILGKVTIFHEIWMSY